MLVYCGCYGCRKWRTYLASDLAEYFGPQAEVGELWSGCRYCKTGFNWRESYRYPNSDDAINGTVIRRLKGWRRIAIWEDEKYSAPEPKPDPNAPKQWRGLL